MPWYSDATAMRIRRWIAEHLLDDGLNEKVLHPSVADALNTRTHLSAGLKTSSSIASGSATVAWTSASLVWDNTKGAALASLATNNRLTVPRDGIYRVESRVEANAGGSPDIQTILRYYSAAGALQTTHVAQRDSCATGLGISLAMTVRLNAGQTIEHLAYQNSGGAFGVKLWFNITRLVPL